MVRFAECGDIVDIANIADIAESENIEDIASRGGGEICRVRSPSRRDANYPWERVCLD